VYGSTVGGNIILVSGGHVDGITGPLPAATTIANFLAQYLDQPGRPQPFGGREAELRRLDEWLRTPGQPYLLLTGLPGQGKSALLSRWCARLTADGGTGDGGAGHLAVVFVPVSIRFGLNRQETVLRALATRLAAIHREPVFAASADPWRDLVGDFLQRQPPPGARVLVVLDGVDEADGWRIGPSLLPASPHPDIKVVVSARLTATHPGPGDWLGDLGWAQAPVMALSALNQQGVRDVLAGMGPPLRALADDQVAVARLHEISAGDPLVVGLYSGYLRDNPPSSAQATAEWLEGANPGIDGFMDRWWADQKQLRPGRAAATSGRVFNLLACAFGPLERGDLLDLANRSERLSGDELDAALEALDRLVIASQGRYAVAHPRLLERRLTRLRQDGELEPVDRDYIGWTAESPRPGKPLSSYVVRHRGQHLERAQAGPDQLLGLLDPAWRSAWLTVTDDVTGWIDDIGRAYGAASRADATAIAAGVQPRWPAVRAWCTCLRAEARAEYDLIDGAFARVLVERGLWSARRALARCARLGKPWHRAAYLTALAPSLDRDGARAAAGLARTVEGTAEEASGASDEMAGDAVAAVVASLVANGDLPVARELLDGIRSPAVRAAGVVATFPALPEGERVTALRDLGRDGADVAMIRLAPAIGRELACRAFGDPPWHHLAGELHRKYRWWPAQPRLDELRARERATALKYLAPWMTPAEREDHAARCIEALAADGSPFGVRDVIQSLAPYLNAATWHRARIVADDLLRDDLDWRLFADAALLPYAPPGMTLPLREHLAQSVPRMLTWSTPADVATALSTLTAEGAPDAVLAGLAELGENNWSKADYLASVAPHLNRSEVSRALAITAGVRRENRPTALTALLTRQAQCGDAAAALAAAAGSADPDEIAAALAVLRIASGSQSFSEAVTALLAIEDRPLRVAAAAAAARLAPPGGTDLLQLVASLGDPWGSADGWLSMEMFASVAREIRGQEWTDAAALRTVAYVIERGVHPRKQHIMVEHFRRFAAALGIEEALRQARLHCTSTWDMPLACAAAAVAARLRPDMPLDRDELVSLATENARVVRVATLGLVPPASRQAVVDAAIQRADGWAEVRPGAAALLLGALPGEFHEAVASALVPGTLLDGPSYLAPSELWPGVMADLCASLDLTRVRRLLAASGAVSSGGGRSRLRAAIAVRLAELGEVDAALDCLRSVDREDAAAALQQMAEFVPAARIPQLVSMAESRVTHDYWRGPLALATAALGRRMSELPSAELSRLLDRWHDRAPHGGEVLVGLLAYGPALLTLGGASAARDLADRLAAP
jgi:hypothetical protein